jgi:endonuclease/exonuclease/phosphatase (EEP) superfamily protein YafD
MLARVVAYDRGRLLLVANSLTYWIFMPEYLVLAVAIAARKHALTACATVVVLAHVIVVWPSLREPSDISPAAYRAPQLRLFAANVLYDNPTPQGIVDEIDRSDADVVMLQEFTPRWHRVSMESSWWDDYPYRLITRHGTTERSAVLSRIPLEETSIDYTHESPVLGATVRVGGRSVRLFSVHPSAPVFDYTEWRAQSEAITDTVAATRGRVVVGGDFNVTQFNAWMDDLEALGLRSAHELVGRGTATTWPNGQNMFPPVRIDHVLVSERVVPLRVREGVGEGSDHKPVIVDLALTAP